MEDGCWEIRRDERLGDLGLGVYLFAAFRGSRPLRNSSNHDTTHCDQTIALTRHVFSRPPARGLSCTEGPFDRHVRASPTESLTTP
jgi:hypothetical protein